MNSRHITLSSLFGLIIFFEKVLLPAPYDKTVSIFIQIFLLSMAFLMAGVMGPVLTGFISGLLTALMRSGFGLMTFSFALLYGVLVSFLNYLFRVVDGFGKIKKKKFIISATFSTLIVGLLSSTLSLFLGIIVYNPVLISVIFVSSAIQGILGGYLSIIVWEKYFYNF